jgi:hypothetical protein
MTPSPWHWDTVSCYTPHKERDDKSVTKIGPFISSEPWIRSNRVPVTNLFSWLDDFCMTMMNDDIAYVGWRRSLSGTPHVSRNLYKYHFRTNQPPTNEPTPWGTSLLRNQGSSDSQILWKLKFYFCVHMSPPPVSILSQMNLVYALISCSFKTDFNKIHLRLDLTTDFSFRGS